MSYCQKCCKEIAESARFCMNCGTPVMYDKQDNTNRKQVYDGVIHKCPNCGEILDSFILRCPTCGYELRDTVSAGAIREFAKKIDEAYDDEQRARLIRNFSIPNTKEDILEFIILASTNANIEYMASEITDAWLTKLEQCHHKADLLLTDDPDYPKILDIYEKAYKRFKSVKNKKKIRKVGHEGGKIGGSIGRAILPALPRSILVIVSIIVFVVALGIDKSGGNSVGYELLGGFLMIISAIMLALNIGSYINVIISVLGSYTLFMLAKQFENGVFLQLTGGINIIFVIICFILAVVEKNDPDNNV